MAEVLELDDLLDPFHPKPFCDIACLTNYSKMQKLVKPPEQTIPSKHKSWGKKMRLWGLTVIRGHCGKDYSCSRNTGISISQLCCIGHQIKAKAVIHCSGIAFHLPWKWTEGFRVTGLSAFEPHWWLDSRWHRFSLMAWKSRHVFRALSCWSSIKEPCSTHLSKRLSHDLPVTTCTAGIANDLGCSPSTGLCSLLEGRFGFLLLPC